MVLLLPYEVKSERQKLNFGFKYEYKDKTGQV